MMKPFMPFVKSVKNYFMLCSFHVYARIDGFLSSNEKIFLNDPNTTSGMMPSSFFFHQAAEIGLNPSQFLTFIIRTSLAKRIKGAKGEITYNATLEKLDTFLENEKSATTNKINVAVILGGYSSERHISVESGRNIYEKLASSVKYAPIPVFLTGSSNNHKMYKVPINALLKDNADDIREKVENWKVHPAIKQIVSECSAITNKYAPNNAILDERIKLQRACKRSIGSVYCITRSPGRRWRYTRKIRSSWFIIQWFRKR